MKPRAIMKPAKKRPKRVNPQRRAKAFAHAYHSVERVEFVKSLGCVGCFQTVAIPRYGVVVGMLGDQSENAHTGKKPGAKLKSHYTTIVPLCPTEHRLYDERKAPYNTAAARAAIERFAPLVEKAWLSFAGNPRTERGQ